MTAIKQNLLNKIQKMLLLKENGAAGEKEAASNLLSVICEKYNINLDSIEAELGKDKVKVYTFKYKTKLQRKLLVQIIYSVANNPSEICYYPRRKLIEDALTVSQFIEITAKYEFYEKEFIKASEIFYTAFLYKHGIFPPNATKKASEFSKEEKEEAYMAFTLSQSIPGNSFHKLIES